MTLRIAVAGKGGVGKTTCSALLLRALALSGVRPLLAVDADPNANLHQLLSLPLPEGLGTLPEESAERALRLTVELSGLLRARYGKASS